MLLKTIFQNNLTKYISIVSVSEKQGKKQYQTAPFGCRLHCQMDQEGKGNLQVETQPNLRKSVQVLWTHTLPYKLRVGLPRLDAVGSAFAVANWKGLWW